MIYEFGNQIYNHLQSSCKKFEGITISTNLVKHSQIAYFAESRYSLGQPRERYIIVGVSERRVIDI